MYNNPYLYNNYYSYQNPTGPFIKRGFLSSLFNTPNKINWNNLLNNTQKTLNVINQASNVYYQVKPIYNNAKTMFRMVHALKDDNDNSNALSNEIPKKNTSNGPVFFV